MSSKLGRPRDVRDTDQRCVAAAQLLFASNGFDGASLRDIAHAVGISSAALVHHFGTKERLYSAVLESLAKSLGSYLNDAREPPSVAAAMRLFDRFLDWSFENQHYSQLLMRELMENKSRVSRARRLHMLEMIGTFVDLLKQGVRAGVFKPIDAELFVFFTLGAITHFSAAAPTIDRMLSDDLGDAITRFKAVLKLNVTSALSVVTPAPSDADGNDLREAR